jgi:hypothetical protein
MQLLAVRPRSRGSVSLRSTDPFDLPKVSNTARDMFAARALPPILLPARNSRGVAGECGAANVQVPDARIGGHWWPCSLVLQCHVLCVAGRTTQEYQHSGWHWACRSPAASRPPQCRTKPCGCVISLCSSQVDLGYFTDQGGEDLATLVSGLKLAHVIASQPQLKRVWGEEVWPPPAAYESGEWG